MSDLARMEKALRAAAAANDAAAAKQIAAEMRRLMQTIQAEGSPSREDPELAGARMAAEGTGVGEAMAIGAGRTLDKLGAGIQQMWQNPANTLPFYGVLGGSVLPPLSQVQGSMARGQEQLKQEQASAEKTMAPLRAQQPFATAIGGAAPYLAIPPSMGVLPSAATIGSLEAAQYGTPGERVTRGVLGAGSAALGGYAGQALGRAIAPTQPSAISGTQTAALRSAENIGIQPRLSEVTGSRFLSRMEDMAARTPGGAGIMDDFSRANAQAINRAAARSIGEQADELTPAVFAQAAERLGRVFEGIKNLAGHPISISKKVGETADDILRQQAKMIPQQQDANLMSLAQQAKLASTHKMRIDGETYQLLRSGLSEASFDASGTNRALYGRLLESLDDSAAESLKAAGQGELASALKSARGQYANLKTLERGMVAEGGNVSPARVAQVLRQKNPSAFREGRMAGPLADIARYGEAFKPLRAGSQTYERETASNLLDLMVRAPWAYGWAKATTSPFMTMYPGFLAIEPPAALLASRAAALTEPATRAATMGLLNAYFQ